MGQSWADREGFASKTPLSSRNYSLRLESFQGGGPSSGSILPPLWSNTYAIGRSVKLYDLPPVLTLRRPTHSLPECSGATPTGQSTFW
jgi:hypothetical protein